MLQPNLKMTDSEWEVMRTIWANDKVTSKEIIEVLQQKKDWGAATIKTFIGRLVKKGMLETEKDGKKFLYSANIHEDDFISSTLEAIFNNICDKDAGTAIAGLIEKSLLSFNDIENLERILERKRQDAVEEVPCSCTPGQCRC